MNVKDALKLSIDMGRMVSIGYVDDLSDEELMPESDLQLDEGIKIIQVGQDDTLAPEKGSIWVF